MALNATQSVDILFKKFVASKATTTTSKQYYEEGYSSVPNVLDSSVWLQGSQIPNTATVSSVTQFVSVTMSYATGSNGAFIDPTGTLVDIIPFGYGDGTSYNYQIFRNNGTTTIGPGQSDWFFDNNSGVLTFFSGTLINGTIVDTGGSGQTLATALLPPIVKAWKYIGKKGVIPNLNGLTYSGGTMSINIGTGLTFSSGQLSVSGIPGTYSGGVTFSNGTVTTTVGDGLTNSNNTLSVALSSGSGLTVSSSGLSVFYGTGLTSSNGQLALSNPISFSSGITNSGNTYSVNINTNGLTFSSGQVSLNIGTGLTFSSGQLQSTSVTTVGSGLTSSGNTYSVNINSNGLTFSSSQLSLNIGTGLTFSSGQLIGVASAVYAGSGLTNNSGTFSINVATASGLTFSGVDNLLNIRYERSAPNTLSNISVAKIGGINAGETFSYTLLELLDKMFYPPAPFVASTIAMSSISNREFGNTSSFALSYTLTPNSGTITSARITSSLGLPTSYVLTTLSSGSITATPSTGTSNITWTISGTYTDGTTNYALSSSSSTLTYQNKRYWGRINLSSIGNPDLGDTSNYPTGIASASALITSATVLGLTGAGVGSGSELATSYSKTYTNINGTGQHLIFAWPTSFGNPTTFNVGGFNVTSFTKVKSAWGFTNSYNYNTSYDVWLTNTTQGSATTIIIS